MYAVVSTGGKQLKVEKGAEAVIEKLDAAVGETVSFDVLFVADGDDVVVDADALASASVTAEVVEHFKGDKQIVFKFKKRKGYKRLKGHRQDQTRVVITDVALTGGTGVVKKKAAPKPAAKAAAPKAAPKPAAKAAAAPAEKPKAAEKPVPAPVVEPTPVDVADEVVADVVATVEVAAAQCEAVKADGERCGNKAKDGSKYCGVHAKKYDA